MATVRPPLLYHAASSYYSMIARLALIEAGLRFDSRLVDIHRTRENQAPWFVRLNPEMTVPVLALPGDGAGDPDRLLPDSRLILEHAFPDAADAAEDGILARLYRFPVDQYTFAWLLGWNPVARFLIPRKLGKIRGDMLQLAGANPDLAEVYRRRAEIFDRRVAAFSQPQAPRWAALNAEVDGLMQMLEQGLAGGPFLGGARYGAADVVATVFLARLRFVRQGRRIAASPAIAAYWQKLHAGDSFRQADVWERLKPSLVLRLIG
ncbi:MAG: glutathione S-transferase family protein [Sneathiellaceae bacterium]